LRELLRLVWDRLEQVPLDSYEGQRETKRQVLALKQRVEDVLAAGIFDAWMTDLDMRQLPPALR
jgi:hypothetical protein